MELFENKAAEYFEYYFDFVENKSSRSANELLSAATRVNDLLRKDTRNNVKKDLFRSNDFLLIKMLRNFNEHSGQVLSDFKMFDKFAIEELKPDLGFFCLISSDVYKSAKNGKHISLTDIKKIDSAASFVGDYVDIHPAIFNLSVYIYECLARLRLSLDTKEYLVMKESYDKETLHEIEHYIKPYNYSDINFSDGSSLEEHIVPFYASHKNTSELPNYNLMTGLDKPLDVNAIDFHDIAKNLKQYIKCIDGKPISYYQEHLIKFEQLESNQVFSSLKHILSYNSKKFENVIINIGAFVESMKGEEIRLKLLNYNISAIFTFGCDKYMTQYDYTYDLLLYLSMVVNIQIHGLEHRETKIMFKIINSKKSIDAAKALSSIRKNKTSENKLSNLIFSQIVMLLIEFPFKDHQKS